MELRTAVHLIKKGVPQHTQPQAWADLGAGNGLFTSALASLLLPGSALYAINTNKSALQQIQIDPQIQFTKIHLDFTKDDIKTTPLDGVLMANSLHFVKDKIAFIEKIKKVLKHDGRILLVEYELDIASQWVPYPISFRKLQELAKATILQAPVFLEETPSLYNGKIYSALLTL